MTCSVSGAHAQRIENKTAIFAALDKVTARISRLEGNLGDTITFGSLKLVPRACYSRSPTEQPKTSSFVEVDEVLLNGQQKRIFTGWMFAESPGLHAVEHPVFDIWLTECRSPAKVATAPTTPLTAGRVGPASPAITAPSDAPDAQEPRRRARR